MGLAQHTAAEAARSRGSVLASDTPARIPAARIGSRGYLVPMPLILGALVAILALLPYLAGFQGVPNGDMFRGTLWSIDDSAVYLTALSAGAHGAWLWHDPFMAHTPTPILMYPTYLAAGHLIAALKLAVPVGSALFAAGSLVLLSGALWVLARPFLPAPDRGWFVAFALAAGGAYWLNAALAVAGHALIPVAMLGSPSLSGFTLGILDAHRALGMAGAIIGAAAALRTAGRGRELLRVLIHGALGVVLLALTMPMLVPLVVPVLCVTALRSSRRGIHAVGRPWALWPMHAVAMWPALAAAPFAIYYLLIFKHGAWSTGTLTTVASPPVMEFLLSMGVLLPFAFWGWRHAPKQSRPLADFLALWCALAVIGRFLPLWQNVRLTDGLNVPSGALIGLGVIGAVTGTRPRTRLLLIAGLGTILYYLLLLADLGAGRATALYTNRQESLAVAWLATHATTHDVVLSSYRFANIAPEACGCRVVAGHFQLTLDFAVSYPRVLTFFGAALDSAARMRVLRATGATLIVYDPVDAPNERFDPRRLPGVRTVYAAGGVTILRVR